MTNSPSSSTTGIDELRRLLQEYSTAPDGSGESIPDLTAYLAHHDTLDYSLDCEFDCPEGLSSVEVSALRLEAFDGEEVDALAFDHKVSPDLIEELLSGKRAPFAGGPFRREDGFGISVKQYTHSENTRLFVQGVYKLAKQLLDPFGFDVYIGLSGHTQDSLSRLERFRFKGELNDFPLHNELVFFRSFLRRHAGKKGLEGPAKPKRKLRKSAAVQDQDRSPLG